MVLLAWRLSTSQNSDTAENEPFNFANVVWQGWHAQIEKSTQCWENLSCANLATQPQILDLAHLTASRCACFRRSAMIAGDRGALYLWGPHLSWKVRSARDRTIRTFQVGVRSEFRKFARIHQKFNKIQECSTCSTIFGEIARKCNQNLNKICWKLFENDEILQTFAEKCEKVWRNFYEILRSERCKSMLSL